MNQAKANLTLILSGAIIATIIALFYIHRHYPTVTVTIPDKRPAYTSPKIPHATSTPDSRFTLPASTLLPVPFTPQAPTANWDRLHNEACEEASAIMAAEYFSGQKNTQLDPELVERQIDRLTKWQDRNFGYYLDATSAEVALMVEQVYGLKTKLVENFSADDIKKELAQNRLVIISENGQKLGNPHYKQPGPIHHMLVVKGYTEGEFVTNDPGTRHGLNFGYDFNTLYNAAADWDHTINTVDGDKKVMIVVWKE